MPSKPLLNKWLGNVTCKPGIQETNLDLLKKRVESADEKDKLAVLCFDEMEIKKCYEYDHRNKQVYGPHKKLQVVILRSLFSNYKETIYFEFDRNMTLDLIEKLVIESESRGLKIYGLSFDLGNKTLLSEIGFRDLKNKIINPADKSRYIYLFPDPPHMIKLLRNHCFDKGLLFKGDIGDYEPLTCQHFIDLTEKDGLELKLCPKLKKIHTEVKGLQRQKVYLATQLFSQTVGKSMLFQSGQSLKVQAESILKIDCWFDVMNSTYKEKQVNKHEY